ncbi:leucine-rich repeat and immunoglobulin-like domain containing-NOGO receptor-interacting protein 4 isoform X2 [Paramacrobiotus metropolitanus]|uniref:leucine-rich repeat and immunoglobulin-like domain containing-NOGO receptor-interacting protein 4 isoform X2 n=1 Tax=Paramacrobiotus metropolitanus TaxID=2943436 RepID=UPI002445930B|nr:leucine-rich repeat and immunoglobulin-like domain containing-NOGO receptor-interacting protein 4 isoform X2 [Paramacrobiotus metropolitanus]
MHDTYGRFIVIRLLSFSALLADFLTQAVADTCPWQCTCTEFIHKTSAVGFEVSCNGRDLKLLPVFPRNTLTIDISGNKFTKIPTNFFPRLTHLHSLWLDNNKIATIEPFSFRGMQNLEVVSIRNNKELNYLSKFSFSGLRYVHRLIITDNNISWIEKNAFYATAYVDTIALYGNPIQELRPAAFNNLKYIQHFRLPVGITTIIPGSFAGLSLVQDLTIESLNITLFRPDTFFNLTDITHLRIHDSAIHALTTPRALAGMERINALIFGRCTIGEENFPGSLARVADVVEFHENDADCCSIDVDYVHRWQQLARTSLVVSEFLHGIMCIAPKWVFEESLFTVNMSTLRNACSGALDRQYQAELDGREKQRPALSELYKAKNSCTLLLCEAFFILVSMLIVIMRPDV